MREDKVWRDNSVNTELRESRKLLFLARIENYKLKDKKKWLVEGMPVYTEDGSCLLIKSMVIGEDSNFKAHRVQKNTVCQYVGIDKNGKPIWENSIVKAILDGKEKYLIVTFREDYREFVCTSDIDDPSYDIEFKCEDLEVIDHLFYCEDVEDALDELRRCFSF